MKSNRIASAKQRELPLRIVEDESVAGNLTASELHPCSSLLVKVVERNNLQLALKQVLRNKGAPGIDGMTVDALPAFLKTHWRSIRTKLLEGQYQPRPVRRVEIAKPNGGVRLLGIPTVLDRFIQQALSQVLQKGWEPVFHPNSFGFRPGKSAHQAVRYAQSVIQSSGRWVVDLDLEAFFDRVNHDRLMDRLKSRTSDRVLLGLVNRYLKAGVQIDSRTMATTEGVPQGGPLSPLLSNIVLDELDWELERRGHRFARYADDCNIFVASRTAGERVMSSIQRFIEDSLMLKVNDHKSAVDRPWNRVFLGFTFSKMKGNRIKVAQKSIEKLKDKVRLLSRRTRGHKLSQIIAELRDALLGWKAYFDISEVLSPLRDLDKWIRRRLRCYLYKQWGRAGYRRLRKLGVDRFLAWNTSKSAHGVWRLSASPALYKALPNRYFRDLGLPELAAR